MPDSLSHLTAARALMRRLARTRSARYVTLLSVIVASAGHLAPAVARASAARVAVTPGTGVLHVDGAKIAYRDLNPHARGTPLLLIVGYGSTMAEWDPPLVSGLTAGRRVVMFDNRGAGYSTGSVTHLSVHLMAQDAAGVIEGLKLGRSDVLGWSMGGFIAQELTLDHPQLVRRLILASTDPGSPHATPGKPAVERTLTNPSTTVAELLSILFPTDQTSAAHAWLTAIGSQPGLTAQAFAVPPATKLAQKNATHTLWLDPGRGTYARLPQLHAPTLVAYGRDDVIVPPSNARLLLTRIPHATGLRVRDAGHAFLFQDPGLSARAFTAFLGHGS